MNGRVQAVRRALDVPYEYEVASAYCRRRDATVELIDLSRVSRDLLPELDDLVNVNNMLALLEQADPDPRADAARLRRRARKLDDGRPVGSEPVAAGAGCGNRRERDPHEPADLQATAAGAHSTLGPRRRLGAHALGRGSDESLHHAHGVSTTSRCLVI